jgi:hypothetical protein
LQLLLSGKQFDKKEREVFKDLPLLVVLSYHTKNTNEQKYFFYRTADIRSITSIYSPTLARECRAKARVVAFSCPAERLNKVK